MAKKFTVPPFKLSPEAKASLQASIAESAKLRSAMESLRETGLDVSAIEEKLEWAEKTRDILLRDFT